MTPRPTTVFEESLGPREVRPEFLPCSVCCVTAGVRYIILGRVQFSQASKMDGWGVGDREWEPHGYWNLSGTVGAQQELFGFYAGKGMGLGWMDCRFGARNELQAAVVRHPYHA